MDTQQPQRAGGVSYGVLAGIVSGIVIGMILVIIFASIVAYNAGVSQGRSNYIQGSCTSYPFLLLPSNQYWACKIPNDMLPGGSQ